MDKIVRIGNPHNSELLEQAIFDLIAQLRDNRDFAVEFSKNILLIAELSGRHADAKG